MQEIGLYKILFYFEAFVHESMICLWPPPTCIARTIAIRLHVYRAIYDAPPTPLLYTIYHTILTMAISCKGQAKERLTCSASRAGVVPRAVCTFASKDGGRLCSG